MLFVLVSGLMLPGHMRGHLGRKNIGGLSGFPDAISLNPVNFCGKSAATNCAWGQCMRYKAFRIQNFKGIKDTTVQLDGVAGASVFAFVGLNESGKTTILEAIHSFSPESQTGELIGGENGVGVPVDQRVPRHLISTFTGKVSVTATLVLDDNDKQKVASTLLKSNKIHLSLASLPTEVRIERSQIFVNGDHQSSHLTLKEEVKVRSEKQRSFRAPDSDEKKAVRDAIFNSSPAIAYFPTFVFDFPETVYLTDRGDAVDKFYRRVFQDILDYDGQGHRIDKDIVNRVRTSDLDTPWTNFLTLWARHADRAKIDHVMDRAGATVSKLIFGRWNKIFGEDARGKDILISYEVVEGEVVDARGISSKTTLHDVVIKFQIKDGTRRFNVNDRSLGFRWFFAFMLFTQFRIARSRSRPLLFLFDEPASNLHAAAQLKLIDCFPQIARDDHMLAYSTHSHYMIEPKWLEQTFIVTNRSDNPSSSILEEASLDDESLDIKVSTYRRFVNDHPNQTSYFQPILDRLQVVPSRFDLRKRSVVLEGKSDYYILRYAKKAIGVEEMPLIPGLGAGTFDALAALSVGWNLNFLFVLDNDRQGLIEKARYSSDLGVPEESVSTIGELSPGLSVIEDLLDGEALAYIESALALQGAPSKGQIRRFFQERLASEQVHPLSQAFIENSKKLLSALRSKLDSIPG